MTKFTLTDVAQETMIFLQYRKAPQILSFKCRYLGNCTSVDFYVSKLFCFIFIWANMNIIPWPLMVTCVALSTTSIVKFCTALCPSTLQD